MTELASSKATNAFLCPRLVQNPPKMAPKFNLQWQPFGQISGHFNLFYCPWISLGQAQRSPSPFLESFSTEFGDGGTDGSLVGHDRFALSLTFEKSHFNPYLFLFCTLFLFLKRSSFPIVSLRPIVLNFLFCLRRFKKYVFSTSLRQN